MSARPEALDLRQHQAHSARMYDYFLGGKDNYKADREAAGAAIHAFPGAMVAARANRAFMHRATRFLAKRGLRQWLDIGTGIPTSPNLHEVAQSMTPDARVVYVDNDPIVLAHARALMSGTPEGRTEYLPGDVTDPEGILTSPQLTKTLDLDEPVVLSLVALLHFVPDNAYEIVRRLLEPLPSGSALVLSHATADFNPEEMNRAADVYAAAGTPLAMRDLARTERFFDGLDLVEPGIVLAHRWHPDETAPGAIHIPTGDLEDGEVSIYAGIGIKP